MKCKHENKYYHYVEYTEEYKDKETTLKTKKIIQTLCPDCGIFLKAVPISYVGDDGQ